jgi:hypothetical protein
LALVLVRDLREHRAPAGENELTNFETTGNDRHLAHRETQHPPGHHPLPANSAVTNCSRTTPIASENSTKPILDHRSQPLYVALLMSRFDAHKRYTGLGDCWCHPRRARPAPLVLNLGLTPAIAWLLAVSSGFGDQVCVWSRRGRLTGG